MDARGIRARQSSKMSSGREEMDRDGGFGVNFRSAMVSHLGDQHPCTKLRKLVDDAGGFLLKSGTWFPIPKAYNQHKDLELGKKMIFRLPLELHPLGVSSEHSCHSEITNQARISSMSFNLMIQTFCLSE
jgi:hypothetical protein